MGLWIFCKLLARGIKRAYYEHEARQRVETQKPHYQPVNQRVTIYNQTVYTGTNDAREQERLRRQEEREEREHQKRIEDVWGVPRINKNAILGEPPNRKKKKRSPLEF